MSDLRLPIGPVTLPDPITPAHHREWIQAMAQAPELLRAAVAGLTDQQLDTPYRPEGWTVRQLVHHLADSHVACYVRFRLALTEDAPIISGYKVDDWAALGDSKEGPVEPSLHLFEGLQRRWVLLLNAMSTADFGRTYRNPDGSLRTLERMLGIYAWHGRHHAAHITALRDRSGW